MHKMETFLTGRGWFGHACLAVTILVPMIVVYSRATSVVVRQLLGQTTNVTAQQHAVNEITTSKQQYVWATFTNDPDRMCELNWLQQNLLRSAIRGVLRPSSV